MTVVEEALTLKTKSNPSSEAITSPSKERYGDKSRREEEEVDDEETAAETECFEEWTEEVEATSLSCPCCPAMILSDNNDECTVAPLFAHCISAHAIDFRLIRSTLKLDDYGWIRLVNYVRSLTLHGNGVPWNNSQEFLAADPSVWMKNDVYLTPILADDPLLYYEDDEAGVKFSSALPSHGASEEIISDLAHLNLRLDPRDLKLQEMEEKCQSLTRAFAEYKDMVRQTFLSNQQQDISNSASFCQNQSDDVAMPSLAAQQTPHDHSSNYYFESYAATEIHESMLKDAVRTEAYRDHIYDNKVLFKGKVVLDVGCGTGILSMFAAKAGAKAVYAVDQSNIIHKAQLNVAENSLDGVISFYKGRMEDVQLPSKVDIIISEWMGYFLLFEGMLDSVLVARDKWLVPGGLVFPAYFEIHLAAMEDEDFLNEKYHYWSNVYGLKMNAMRDTFMREGHVGDTGLEASRLCDGIPLLRFDTRHVRVDELDFKAPFMMIMNRDGMLTNFSGWFDTWFSQAPASSACNGKRTGGDDDQVFFSTSPWSTTTHWKQTHFFLDEPLVVCAGDECRGWFTCSKSTTNPRELECRIEGSVFNRRGEEEVVVRRFAQSFGIC